VRVTGTKFNVRLESAEVVEVTVLEGSVVVTLPGTKSDPLKLGPGDQLLVTGGAANVHQVTPDQLQDAIAWVKGFVVFDRMPLRDAAARYASYHDKRIEVDPTLALKPYGGKLRIADLDGFLQSLPLQIPEAEVTTTPEGVIRIAPRQ
jgi:ferric-dicitrate binding protein FerR (iron transport regulator)